ncbi:Uncharacterized protein FWK35_00013428, partial [Aphis craccivora]
LNLQHYFVYFESHITIKYKIDVIPTKILLSIFFVMGDFTLRLLKNIEKMILRKSVLSMLRVGQREKTTS